jgi:pimeloyl-ACP methyl ester carboxylesterase
MPEPDSVRQGVGPDGGRLSYLTAETPRAGLGQTILLIHGAGMSARSWTEQLRGLAHTLRVVAIDLPGHGESDPIPETTVEAYADAAGRLLATLRTGRVFVAGHSLGGAVALALAGRHPKVTKGLVLVSSCAKLSKNAGALEGLLRFLPGPIRKIVSFSMARKLLFPLGASRRAVRLGMKELAACRPETIRKDMAAAKAMDLEGVAQGLRVPTLILCGTGDRVTPVTLSQRLNDLIPGSQLHLVEAAGHMLPLEVPERVSQEILDFVELVSEGRVRRLLSVGGRTERTILRQLRDNLRQLRDKAKTLWPRR